MEEIDVVEKIVTTEPEIPVYVPYAGYTVPGIASFDSGDFHVDNFGNVKFSDEIDKIRDDAQDAADAAAASASAAATSETNAKSSEDAAKQYAADSLVSETNATAAKNAAVDAQEAAEAAEAQTLEYRDSAETYKTDAYNSKVAAETAQHAAENSKNLAIQQADKASDFADAANSYMQQASNFASSANTSAQSASNNALLAEQYRNEAKEYAKKEYIVVDSFADLPNPGDSAFIYLVPTSGGASNDSYSEYLWISEDNKYEYIGSVNDVDLSNYAQVNGNYQGMTVGAATRATQDGDGNIITDTYATKAENASKYTKPAAGIPESDLTESVQEKLNASYKVYPQTLPAAAWSGNQQTVTVSGLTDNAIVQIFPTDASAAAYAQAGISVTQNGSVLTFTCETVPTVNLSVTVWITGYTLTATVTTEENAAGGTTYTITL